MGREFARYENPDPRCKFPYEPTIPDYCLEYAKYVKGKPGYKDIKASCRHCDFWSQTPRKELTMKDNATFWLVWCPGGATLPTRRHRTIEDAEVEAERLAKQSPKSRFYVLQACTAFEKTDVVRVELEPPF